MFERMIELVFGMILAHLFESGVPNIICFIFSVFICFLDLEIGPTLGRRVGGDSGMLLSPTQGSLAESEVVLIWVTSFLLVGLPLFFR